MIESDDVYLQKAQESLDGAESEFTNRRYNNAANRCYYACFQAAIAALSREDIQPRRAGEWGHEFVQGEFVRQLINRRKVYAAALRDALARTQTLRNTADYEDQPVLQVQAARALRRARAMVEAVVTQGGESA